ncbi:MAG: S49 family peptidase [Myxococcales bacterium]|nr:S49 family peptidase [Myxococcales bacterium]
MTRAIIVAALALVLGAGTARAQSAQALYAAPTLRSDAYSTVQNPASLRFVDGFSVAGAVVPGSEGPRPWSAYVGYGPGRWVGVGAAARGDGLRVTSTAALAVGTERLAIGFSHDRTYSDRVAVEDGFTTSTLSLTARPLAWLGLSLVVRNPTTPRLAGAPVARVIAPGLALRTAAGALGLEGWYEAAEGRRPDAVGATALFRPTPALRLFASTSVGVGELSVVRARGGVEVAWGPSAVGYAFVDGDGDPAHVVGIELATPGFTADAPVGEFLRIDLAGDLRETPAARIGGARGDTFTDTLLALRRVAEDPRSGGVFVNLGGLTAGGAQLMELRAALDAVQASGKQVVVYFEAATVRDLYVAANADFAAAAPTLSVLDAGLSVTRYYLGDLLRTLGVEAQFVRIGAFKSGPERYTNGEPSEEATAQLDAYLDDLWDSLVADLRPGVVVEEVEAWLSGAPLSATALLDGGELDAVVYRDALAQAVSAKIGRPFRVTRELSEVRRERWTDAPAIAILHISGVISAGRSGDALFGEQAGALSIAAACAELADARDVRAVIVRIDSPGGSATASDTIHHALTQLAEAKPVIVSMGDIAASGGMYAAAMGGEIHATPATLTGSIGIYAGSFSVEGLLSRVDVGVARADRGGPADLFSGRTWSDDERAAVQRHIEGAYELFLDRVATARGMTPDAVDAIGQGRIWSGRRAQEVGLVDALDGFLGAWDAARSAAGIRAGADVTVLHYPRVRPTLASVLPDVPALRSLTRATGETLDRLGVGSLLRYLAAAAEEPPGAAMAQLDWVLEGL